MSTATQRSRRREERAQVRERILGAASELLRTRPYRDLSVDELMSSAGLTRTIFYRHFDDLPDLVVRLLEETSDELLDEERRLVQSGSEEREAIRHALSAPVLAFKRHGPLLRAVAEAASHDEQIEQGFQSLLERFALLIEDYLRGLAAEGRNHFSDPRQAARALNLMNAYYLLEVFGKPEPAVSEETALQTLTEIWIGALRA